MPDDGPRGSQPIGDPPSTDVSLQQYLMSLQHALDERVASQIHNLEAAREARTIGLEKAVDARFNAFSILLDQRAVNQELNIKTALASLNARLDSMNEFRAQMADERGNFITRREVETWQTALVNRLDRDERSNDDRLKVLEVGKASDDRFKALESKSSNMDGRFWALGVGLTVFIFVVNLLMRFIPTAGK